MSTFSTHQKSGKDDYLMQASNLNELKSASSSSLTNNSALSHNNSDHRLNHSYQAGNHPLNSLMQSSRLRAALTTTTAYDSSASASPVTIQNPNTAHNAFNYAETGLNSPLQHYQYQNHSLNAHSNRPNSSSSSSSSHNYSNPMQLSQHSEYSRQYTAASINASHSQQYHQVQVKSGRQLTTPSPTMLANSMVPLSLLSAHDNVPISLPQRENLNYYNWTCSINFF